MRRKTIEEYMETIYVLEKREGRARTGRIASEMSVKPPSVTEMLQKLQKDGLVKYETYTGATLTSLGKKKAQELMRRHKVIADFIEIIGVERELAEIDACQLEHHVSPKTIEKLKKFVGFVRSAPGDPKWIRRFKRYCETGERIPCDFYSAKASKKSKRSKHIR